MDDRQLRNFLMIVKCGSITRAADRLRLSQPSLSHQLLRLEDELGVPLFIRNARGVTLTDAGRLFQEHAGALLATMDRVCEDVRRHHTAPSGDVMFAMSSSTSQLLGVPLLIAAREKYPEINLHLREGITGAIHGWLEDGAADIAVLYHAERSARHLAVKPIAYERLFLVGPPDEFGEVDERGVAIAQVPASRLAGMQLVLPAAGGGLRKMFARYSGGRDHAPVTDIQVDSLPQIRTLVALGVGFTVMPHAAVSEDLLAGRLAAAMIEGIDLRRSVSVARNPARAVTRASVAIEDLALAILGGMIADGRWITEPLGPDGDGVATETDIEAVDI